MNHRTPSGRVLSLGLASCLLVLGACGGGGGGGGGGGDDVGGGSGGGGGATQGLTSETFTYQTTSTLGDASRVDVVDGGLGPADPGAADGSGSTGAAKLAFLNVLRTRSTDLNGDLADLNGDTVPDTAFLDPYRTGLNAPSGTAARIYAANNVYDMIQTTTGSPRLLPVGTPINGSAGGPGHTANVAGNPMANVLIPPLPNTMGELNANGSGRGPSPTDEHQFIQIQFPFAIDTTSVFNPFNTPNSFLGDSSPPAGLTGDNVSILAYKVFQDPDPDVADQFVQIDQPPVHVTGIAVVGGVTSIPGVPGLGNAILTAESLAASNIPLEARSRILDPSVFTYIAHEAPSVITTTSDPVIFGRVDPATNILTLPDPTSPGNVHGGRVFGANQAVPGSVNDFANIDPMMDPEAAAVGFFNIRFSHLRTGSQTVQDAYFHTFDVAQDNVGDDPRAPFGNASFTRGPAINIDDTRQEPSINVLDPKLGSSDILSFTTDFPTSDQPAPSGDASIISTRAKFRINFDREVIPNSVGFSRRHTLHAANDPGTGQDLGVIFKFNGNTRPVPSPAAQFVQGAEGAPLAASVYLAVNQPATRKVNSPTALSVVSASGFGQTDAGVVIPTTQNGLDPEPFNRLATLPRGVVPFDCYPVNQNNLQSYIIEPLVELPPGSVVTLGVCVQGLNLSGAGATTNRGNFTRAGTMFTTFQGLTPTGLGAGDQVVTKTTIIGDQTIIKVNAGPMDFRGNRFYGGTAVSVNTLVNGDILLMNGMTVSDDTNTGGFNVSRSFRVGNDDVETYVNAPVSPMAMYAAYSNGRMGIVDLSGTGFNTNAPGGGLVNTAFKNYLIVPRLLPPTLSGKLTNVNWQLAGKFPTDHLAGFGILGRYTSGGSQGVPSGVESEHAIGRDIAVGFQTPTPGINEGSSGFETLVKNSRGSAVLGDATQLGLVRDIVVGDFLDTIFFDPENTFSGGENHRTIFAPAASVSNNTIADPPLPNPPPMRFPVGLPHTAVIFDQDDLSKAPSTIEGSEVFSTDSFMQFNDGATGAVTATASVNTFIQLNPTFNTSNPNTDRDIPPLPNPGFPDPFGTGAGNWKFVQTGPMPKTSTTGAVILTQQNLLAPPATANGLVPASFQSRQQIGNFLFVADGTNRKVHAINSNTMEIIQSIKLPDPYGLGLTSDLTRLWVSNEDDNTVSLINADPRSNSFMTELNRIPVGIGPRAVAAGPDQEDVFVLNYAGNTISIIDITDAILRKTLSQSGINRPFDMAVGMREVGGAPAFTSGTYHGYISNHEGNNVLVYESNGPDPNAEVDIGFDAIIGAVMPNANQTPMVRPRGIVYDPTTPYDAQAGTVGAYVAHNDNNGRALISRVSYSSDDSPGLDFVTPGNPGFGFKVFTVINQYKSNIVATALDVALIDYTRRFFVEQTWGSGFPSLFNSGSVLLTIPGVNLPRNAKYPLTALGVAGSAANNPRWEPDRVYLTMSGGRIASFDVFNPQLPPTVFNAPQDVSILASYFSQ